MIRIQYELTGPDFEELPKRGLNYARRHANAVTAGVERDHARFGRKLSNPGFKFRFLGTRFNGRAAAELGWAERTPHWRRTKRILKPGSENRPMFFTGRTWQRVTGGGMKITTNNRGWSLVVSGLHQGFSRRQRTSRRSRVELAAVSRGEVDVMAANYAYGLKEGLDDWMARNQKKVVIV